jgi:sec-independent protein translocase protein TatA
MVGDILQPTHLLLILVVALLVLGPKRLPEAGRALGQGIRDFKSALNTEEQNHGVTNTGTSAPAPPQLATAPEPIVAPAAPPAQARSPARSAEPARQSVEATARPPDRGQPPA